MLERVLDPLELELWAVVSCHVGAENLNLGLLQEHPVLLAAEPFSPPQIGSFLLYVISITFQGLFFQVHQPCSQKQPDFVSLICTDINKKPQFSI